MKARRREPSSPPARRPDRWAGAIISGFIATMAMLFTLLVAYYVAGAISQSLPQDNPLMVWLWSLTHNSLVDVASRSFVAALGLHLTFGLIWAVVYAYFFEPVLPGNDWQKGLLFALLPWILSLVVFLPIAGAGILGLALGAGPLPIIGNLILHLVYGAALGLLYGLGAESWALGLPQAPAAPEEYQRLVARRSEVGTAVGLLAGTMVGGAVGWLTCGLAIAAFGAQLAVVDIGVLVLVSVIIGGSGGALVGSLAGIGGRALS